MTALYSISSGCRGILMMLLYLLLLVQFGCMFAVVSTKGKHLMKFILPAFVITCVLVIYMWNTEKRLYLGMGIPGKGHTGRMYGVSVEGILLLTGILCIYTIFCLIKIRRYTHNTITQSSIKESIDNLPTGLSFSAPDGFILLANRRMESLCYGITGKDFQDAEDFWRILCSGNSDGRAKCLTGGKTPTFRLFDRSIWTFEKKILSVEGAEIIQITAADITELHELSEDLKKNNEKLKEINSRLRQYGENIEALVRSREILETKSRIHNEMGQALLASHCYLSKDSALFGERDILQRWNYVLALLKKKAEPGSTERTWDYFTEAAASAGVKIITDGALPEDEKVIRLAVAAGTEALTNAVRHAGADELYIKITKEEHAVRIVFTNNGRVPEQTITEGGGLGALRARMEEAGGTFETESKPRLALIMTVPVV